MPYKTSAAENATWLFTRNDQSIWVERSESRTMTVTGPGRLHVCYDFDSDARLLEFQVSLAEQLSTKGWLLRGFNVDRRADTRLRVRQPHPGRAEGRGRPVPALTVLTGRPDRGQPPQRRQLMALRNIPEAPGDDQPR